MLVWFTQVIKRFPALSLLDILSQSPAYRKQILKGYTNSNFNIQAVWTGSWEDRSQSLFHISFQLLSDLFFCTFVVNVAI